MTGLPAALSALAFASTASVADSLIAAMRREMRRSAGESADVGSEETAVMPSMVSKTTQAHVGDRGRRRVLDAPPAGEGVTEAVEQPLPAAEQHRDDHQVHLVHQA